MAVKGSGVVKETIDPPMKDQTSSNIARSGAPKHTQTHFPIHSNMVHMTNMLSSVGPKNPGMGPDASSSNPLDPEPLVKVLRRQSQTLQPSWQMRDANGKSINGNMASLVLKEAAHMGKVSNPNK